MSPKSPSSKPTPDRVLFGNRILVLVEDVVYVGIALLLTIASAVVLVQSAVVLFEGARTNDPRALVDLLDSLLLVFIFVELLFAVRSTLQQRQIVAEPFLLAGILASIKEIIVLSVAAADDYIDQGPQFARAMTEIGLLAGTVVLLAFTAVLLRRKEREPEETSTDSSKPPED